MRYQIKVESPLGAEEWRQDAAGEIVSLSLSFDRQKGTRIQLTDLQLEGRRRKVSFPAAPVKLSLRVGRNP